MRPSGLVGHFPLVRPETDLRVPPQRIPLCPECPPGEDAMAVMKPDIVFFGEGLSPEFHQAMARDKAECDLLIVMGSSLKVRPVALIPSKCFPLPRTALCVHCREVDPEVAAASAIFRLHFLKYFSVFSALLRQLRERATWTLLALSIECGKSRIVSDKMKTAGRSFSCPVSSSSLLPLMALRRLVNLTRVHAAKAR